MGEMSLENKEQAWGSPATAGAVAEDKSFKATLVISTNEVMVVDNSPITSGREVTCTTGGADGHPASDALAVESSTSSGPGEDNSGIAEDLPDCKTTAENAPSQAATVPDTPATETSSACLVVKEGDATNVAMAEVNSTNFKLEDTCIDEVAPGASAGKALCGGDTQQADPPAVLGSPTSCAIMASEACWFAC
ncbi:unnamed protein product [Effrenium voratum]|uniref:Uncharacterized protein n=1 Tax=Effrenium voratum TaxID=2562239 RepID=A0AA36J744_9DINO|nr:unnamed protein product [Effrenium voratum]